MASKITLKNAQDTEFTIIHNDNKNARTINGEDISAAIDTVNDFPLSPNDGDVVIVRDLNRGGTFIYDSTEVGNDNQGTNFSGWIRQYSGAVNVKWFGAKGNGINNDQPIIQSIINGFATTVGGELFFPSGTYRLESAITISSSNIKFTGSGKGRVYPAVYTIDRDDKSYLLPVFSGDGCIVFASNTINTAGTFSAENINLTTYETGLYPTAAFLFDGALQFHRDYIIRNCGIYGFTSAFDIYDSGTAGAGLLQFAGLHVSECNINKNDYIARTLDGTQWNSASFYKNELGQNALGGIQIQGHSVSIVDNIMEGQPNTIKSSGNYKGWVIKGNYFEVNSGDYVIQLTSLIAPEIGPNFYNTITASETVELINCTDVLYLEKNIVPHTNAVIGNLPNKAIKAPDSTEQYNGGSIMFPFDINHVTYEGDYFSEGLYYGISTPSFQPYNIPDAGLYEYTSASTGVISISGSSSAYIEGDIIMAVAVVSYKDDVAIAPRLRLNINTTSGTDGISAGIFYGFNGSDSIVFKRNTFTIISYARATASNTATSVAQLYPFGLNPSAGLKCGYNVRMYNLGQKTELIPHVSAEMLYVKNAAPVAGTWSSYSKLRATPAPSGIEGYVCVTGGTPGIWKTFGTISA